MTADEMVGLPRRAPDGGATRPDGDPRAARVITDMTSMLWRRRGSVRLRLTIAATAVVGVALVAGAIAVLVVLRSTLTEDVRALSQAVSAIPSICIDAATIVGCLAYLAMVSGPTRFLASLTDAVPDVASSSLNGVDVRVAGDDDETTSSTPAGST